MKRFAMAVCLAVLIVTVVCGQNRAKIKVSDVQQLQQTINELTTRIAALEALPTRVAALESLDSVEVIRFFGVKNVNGEYSSAEISVIDKNNNATVVTTIPQGTSP
jgi:hypothetical protein